MIQLLCKDIASSPFVVSNDFSLDIADKLTIPILRPLYLNTDHIHNPLCIFTSKFTGKSASVVANIFDSFAYLDRYLKMGVFLTRTYIASPSIGFLLLGTTDLPLGFYDVKIYQNSSRTNLDPSGLNELWTGLANLKVLSGDTPSVVYK